MLLIMAVSAFAQDGLSERIYLTTDRAVYVAGDVIRISVFCYDAATGDCSDFSSIAYLELHSASAMVATGKAALVRGRGSSEMEIPAGVPTGNYRLVAYTAQNINENGMDYMAGARTVSIFNTFSTERVEGGVQVVSRDEYKTPAAPRPRGGVSVSVPSGAVQGGTVPVVLRNSGKAASMSVSVRHDDGIAAPQSADAAVFRAGLKPGKSFTQRRIPEYEGEIIYGRIVGLNPAQIDSLYGKSGFISAPGNSSDVYSASIHKGAGLTFFTSNIYGDRDLVCEIENLGSGVPCHIELDSPFVNVPAGDIPVLSLCSSFREALEKRTLSSRIEKSFAGKLIPEYLPVKENVLFGDECLTYKLDDYTRFPTMEEVIVEFVSELRLRRNPERKRDIQVRLNDVFQSARYSDDAALMMVDGIPVFDYDRILDYDPLLVKSVNIYPYTYYVGTRSFDGIVNFETYHGNMPGVAFDPNVRIVDFHGCPYPTVYTAAESEDEYPDYRQTAYWHPLVDIPSEGEYSFDVKLPEYPGTFAIEVAGFDEDGKPVNCCTSFEVK